MAAPPASLARILADLERLYGKPKRPIPSTPLDWILWENVAYLVDDGRREIAFDALATRVGLTAEKIARASSRVLHEVTRLGGMHPEQRIDRLKSIAEVAIEHGGGDLRGILELDAPSARKILKQFTSIGDPGAEKILMFCGALPVLALESNGLRVLTRLGYGEESKSYARTYKSVQLAVAGELKKDCEWLSRAHLLLRTHGQALCKRASPDCDACPLTERCQFSAQLG
jgi:endonuclease III